jgi:hypothetical protein
MVTSDWVGCIACAPPFMTYMYPVRKKRRMYPSIQTSNLDLLLCRGTKMNKINRNNSNALKKSTTTTEVLTDTAQNDGPLFPKSKSLTGMKNNKLDRRKYQKVR